MRCPAFLEPFCKFTDLLSTNMVMSLVGEFTGTMCLVLLGCGSCIWYKDSDLMHRSTVFGIMVVRTVQFSRQISAVQTSGGEINGGHKSWGHINPAVSIACLVTGRIGLLRCALYVFVQSVGAVTGAVLLHEFIPVSMRKSLGATLINAKISVAEGFGVEFLATFVLVLTVFAVWDENREDMAVSTQLAIGLAVVICHLFAIPYTGSSMNPARSLGPAMVMGIWDDHWVYWTGPILGGISAAVFYKFLLSTPRRDFSTESLIDEEMKYMKYETI